METHTQNYASLHPELFMDIASFMGSAEMLAHIANIGGFDLTVLDICMEDITGIDAAHEIRAMGKATEIIFISSSPEYVCAAFDVEALQYRLKPYDEAAFFAVLDRAVTKISKKQQNFITIKTAEGIFVVNMGDILYAETGYKNYQDIHFTDGSVAIVRITVTNLFDTLPCKNSFVRVPFIVNLAHIKQISVNRLAFNGDTQVYVPQRALQILKKSLMDYCMNGLKRQ